MEKYKRIVRKLECNLIDSPRCNQKYEIKFQNEAVDVFIDKIFNTKHIELLILLNINNNINISTSNRRCKDN